jgi:hypothetical protein
MEAHPLSEGRLHPSYFQHLRCPSAKAAQSTAVLVTINGTKNSMEFP